MSTTQIASPGQESLLLRLGGVAAVAPIATALYERVRADAELDDSLRCAHRGSGISHRHFSLLCSHLIDVLADAGVAPDDADDVIEWLARARDAVVER